MSYVQRRANRYEFRYRLPDDLAGRPAPSDVPAALSSLLSADGSKWKREVVRSLKTADQREANKRVLPHIAEMQSAIEDARYLVRVGTPQLAEFSPAQIEKLAAAHEARIVGGDVQVRRAGLGLSLHEGSSAPDGQGMTEDDIRLYRFVISDLGTLADERALRMRSDAAIKARVSKALAEHGISPPSDPASMRELELQFAAAEQRGLRVVQARLSGEQPAVPVHPAPAPSLKLSQPWLPVQPRHSGITLADALERWAAGGGRGAKRPRDRTRDEAAAAVRLFHEMHGDLPISQITKAHARAFRDALAKLPKALPDRLRTKSIPELLKLDLSSYPQRSAQTTNKILNLLSGVLSRAERDGYLDEASNWSNPFRVGLEIAATERQPYEPFSLDELKRLFASPVFGSGLRPLGGGGDAAFWFPLIALYSGARRTEIAQLRIGDVRTSPEGIHFFDFNDDDQNLKNASSARSVPIHPELVAKGLLAYVAERRSRAQVDQPLWPGFEPPIAGKTAAWTKWFARYVGEHVTTSKAKTFHSFRHTFKRACREAGITEEIHHALTGHAGGGVGRSYGRERREDGSLDRGVSIQRLAIELEKLRFDIAL